MAELTVSVPEGARALGVGVHSLYRAAREGRIAVLRVGRKVRIPRRAIEEVLANPDRFNRTASAGGEEARE
jgi:excisionase family DNA binding protein